MLSPWRAAPPGGYRPELAVRLRHLMLRRSPSNRTFIHGEAFSELSCYIFSGMDVEEAKLSNANSDSGGHTKGREPVCHRCSAWDPHL